MDCVVDGCEKPAALLPNGRLRHGGKCHTHAKRQTRRKPMHKEPRAYGRTGETRLRHAALRLADAETDEDERRALETLLRAARRLRRKPDNVQKQPKTPVQG